MDPFSRKLVASAAILAVGVLGACSDDDDNNGGCASDPTGPGCQPATADITADFTQNTTLSASTAYTLSGFIHVNDGITLTIEPGTVIKGDADTPTALFVMPGGRIIAEGRADAPIVLTSERPEGQRRPGDWGGLIIVGRGQVNRTSPTILEGSGTSASNPEINYAAGTSDTDDSGILRYVRVEFAGFGVEQNVELNSFTFAAVGSGTQMDHLQALAGLDDHFEWFGGAVDARHLVSYEAGDDHFDMSEGFRGRLQFLVALQTQRLDPAPGSGSFSSDPQGIENDGCDGDNCKAGRNSEPLTSPVVANFTLVGTGPGVVDATSGGIGMLIRRGSAGHYVNGVVARWPKAAFSLRDPETEARFTAGDASLSNVFAAEVGAAFESGSGRFTVDAAANNLEIADASVTAASLFTRLAAAPASASDLDWSLAAGAAPAAGGLATFTGDLATRAGSFVQGTAYRGASLTDKWWQGWTIYADQ